MATALNPYDYAPVPVDPPGGLLASAVGTPLQPLPPIDPNTYENDDVVGQLNSITAADSGYMQLARTSGLQTANRRGLLNTSLAAGASQAAAIAAAAPLAQQNAGQAASRNLARVQGFYTGQQQDKDIAARERMLASQLSSEETRLGRQLTSQEQMQMRDISNKLEMQGIDLATQRQMQQEQITSSQRIAQMNIDSEEARLGRTLTAQEVAQQKDLAAQQARQQAQIAASQKLTELQEAGALARTNIDATTRTKLAELETATAKQTAALNYYLAQDQIYAQSVSSLYANADMPAPARDAAIQQFQALKTSNLNLPAALLGINLKWKPAALPPIPSYTSLPPTTTTTGGVDLSHDGIPHNDGIRTSNS